LRCEHIVDDHGVTTVELARTLVTAIVSVSERRRRGAAKGWSEPDPVVDGVTPGVIHVTLEPLRATELQRHQGSIVVAVPGGLKNADASGVLHTVKGVSRIESGVD